MNAVGSESDVRAKRDRCAYVADAEDLPLTVYAPGRGSRDFGVVVRGLFNDIFGHQSRDLAWRMFIRNVASQYRQTLFGYFWLFFPPLINSGIFIFLHSQKVMQVTDTIIPYAVFTLIGNLLWQSMLQCLRAPLASIEKDRAMITKLNFPREAMLSGAFLEGAFTGLIPLVAIPLILLFSPVNLTAWMFLIPVGVLMFMLLGFAIGVFLTPLGLLYRDVGQAIPIAARFWMFLSPVVYAIPEEGMARNLLLINPATVLLENARNWIVGLPPEFSGLFILYGAMSVVLLFVGLVIFRLAMPIVVERLSA